MREKKQRVASLEQDARQPRLAMEADVKADKKTCERTEGAAKAVQAMHGDSFSATRVDPDPKSSTSFGDDFTGSRALSCSRDDALVGNGAAALKSCLSPLEMRSPTTTGGLLPADKASTTTRITFYQPRLRFCPIEKTSLRGRQLNTPCTTSAVSGRTSFLPPPGGGLYKQSQGRKWCWIPAG